MVKHIAITCYVVVSSKKICHMRVVTLSVWSQHDLKVEVMVASIPNQRQTILSV